MYILLWGIILCDLILLCWNAMTQLNYKVGTGVSILYSGQTHTFVLLVCKQFKVNHKGALALAPKDLHLARTGPPRN